MSGDQRKSRTSIAALTPVRAIVRVRDFNWILNASAATLMGALFIVLGLPGLSRSLDPALQAAGLLLATAGIACLWRTPETLIDIDRAVSTIRGPFHKRTVPLKEVSHIGVQSSGTNVAMAGLAPLLSEGFEVVLCLRSGDVVPTYRNLGQLEAANQAEWLSKITGIPVIEV